MLDVQQPYRLQIFMSETAREMLGRVAKAHGLSKQKFVMSLILKAFDEAITPSSAPASPRKRRAGSAV